MSPLLENLVGWSVLILSVSTFTVNIINATDLWIYGHKKEKSKGHPL